ncbi:MAG: PfkB family carbohydrate kinase [Candidatus Margulisbacteria bacterium]|nr:PfkB family carbohydrate kinase [Candidatus Margulisiibacteriota bacterium]
MTDIYNKIKTIDELGRISAELKQQSKKIVHCHGVFDLLHPGHLRHLASAKKEGDILVVTITADKFVKRGPGRPIFNEELRAESLASIGSVDYVAIDRHPTAVEAIKIIKPDVYVKGQEYEKKDKNDPSRIPDEEGAVQSVGGRLAFTYDLTFSSSKLINDNLDVHPAEVRRYLQGIAEKYTIDGIADQLGSARRLKTLVIGDAIVDQYHYCEAMGKSLKEHLVVSKYMAEESFAGGVFATANNTAQLCGEVHLVSVLGRQDSHEKFITEHLQPNITPKFFYRADAPTTVKRRYVSTVSNQKVFEICYINDLPLPTALEAEVIAYLDKIIAGFDLVIVSDFGHGFLNKGLVELICRQARFLALNVQTNSANTGFNLITKYPRANYVTVDEPEIRLAAHSKHDDLQSIMKELVGKSDFANLMVTRGHLGSLDYDKKSGFHESPALASRIVDRVGAGDAFFAYTAPCRAAGVPQDLLSFIGNAVGALKVQIVCNRSPVDVVDLKKYVTRLLK